MITLPVERIKRQGALVLPSLFTLANMSCGFFAILAAADGLYGRAAWLIFAGMVADSLDGKVARLVHGESAFGVEFDSLADFLSFCVAPAYLMHELLLQDIPIWGGVVAFIYALCGGLRLARFNILAQMEGGGSSGTFSGLPTPAAAGILASFVLLYDILETDRPVRTIHAIMGGLPYLYAAFPMLMVAIALLMVSTVPYKAFKSSLRPSSVYALLLMVVAAAFVFAFPQNALFLIFSAYLFSGVVGWLVSTLRRAPKT